MNAMQYEKIGALKDGELFEWTVPGWILNHKYSTKRSDLFAYARFPNFKFCLTLRPYSNAIANSVSFNLQLHRIPVFTCGVNSESENSSISLPEIDVRFILYKMDSVHRWSCSMKMEDDRLTADFPEISTYDSLTIQCLFMPTISTTELEMSCTTEKSFCNQALSEDTEESHTLSHDMGSLLDSGDLSDVTLCVEDKEFNVHRCILVSRSKVFTAMFNHDTREKLENRIVIEDLSSEIVSQILQYIYTDKIDELTAEQYLSLFSAADKYAITNLQKRCSKILQRNLPLKSVISVLITADLHKDDDLKEKAVQVFLKNAVSVMNCEEWKPFLKYHTELASSILIRLANSPSSSQISKRETSL